MKTFIMTIMCDVKRLFHIQVKSRSVSSTLFCG